MASLTVYSYIVGAFIWCVLLLPVFTRNNAKGFVRWMKWLLTFIYMKLQRKLIFIIQWKIEHTVDLFHICIVYIKMLKLEACAYVMKFDIMSKVFEWIFMSHLHEHIYMLACIVLLFIWGFPLFVPYVIQFWVFNFPCIRIKSW